MVENRAQRPRPASTHVTADSELGAATVGWKSIEKIWEFPEAWLLFVGKQQYVTVPLPALTEELKKAIKTEVEKNKRLK